MWQVWLIIERILTSYIVVIESEVEEAKSAHTSIPS
jgi:hypothetical protein